PADPGPGHHGGHQCAARATHAVVGREGLQVVGAAPAPRPITHHDGLLYTTRTDRLSHSWQTARGDGRRRDRRRGGRRAATSRAVAARASGGTTRWFFAALPRTRSWPR